ncbi:hypothetical protein TNCV_230731 [Trichonephila clavipes]|nr:hypothetical protein TNCV_230731 [Trichonephila clavipes]
MLKVIYRLTRNNTTILTNCYVVSGVTRKDFPSGKEQNTENTSHACLSLEEFVVIDDDNVYTASIIRQEFAQSSKNIIDADSNDKDKLNKAAHVPTSSEMRNIIKKEKKEKARKKKREGKKLCRYIFLMEKVHSFFHSCLIGCLLMLHFEAIGSGPHNFELQPTNLRPWLLGYRDYNYCLNPLGIDTILSISNIV